MPDYHTRELIVREADRPDADTVARDTEAVIDMCSIQLEYALCSLHLLALTDGETTHNPTHTTRWKCVGNA